jgi:hypothetical protein
MEGLVFHWNETIAQAPGRDDTWRRNIREAILGGLLADCVLYGILDSTRGKLLTQSDKASKLTESSLQSTPRQPELGCGICGENHEQDCTRRDGN